MCLLRPPWRCGRGHLKISMEWLCKICTYINFLFLHMQSICSTVSVLFIFVQLQMWSLKSFEFVLDELHVAVLRLCLALVLRLLSQHLFSFPLPSHPIISPFHTFSTWTWMLVLEFSPLTNCLSWVSVLFSTLCVLV